MESTPIIQSDSSPGHQDMENGNHLYTPVSYTSNCRKRKIMQAARRMKYLSLNTSEPSPVPYYSTPEDTSNNEVLTSTMNESTHVPNFATFASNIYGTFGENTPNLLPEETTLKRQRLCSTFAESKHLSPPNTPVKDNCPDFGFNKSSSFSFTPSKKYLPKKVETPEKFKILYPHLMKVKTPSKPKTPQKLRESIFNSTPVKKRLFARDPLEYFCILSKHVEIVRKIFDYLNPEDLVQVQKVSPLWKQLVTEDKKSKMRVAEYTKAVQREKENYNLLFSSTKPNLEVPESFQSTSPPPSPNSINYVRYKKAAANLDSSKELTKCFRCLYPAVKQGYICQCLNRYCSYIWCQNCLSSSVSGPENFTDRCAKAELSLSPLSNLSNIDYTPSFLLNTPANHSATQDSSGYFSTSDVNNTGKMKALQDNNNIPKKVRRATLDATPVLSVKSLAPKRETRDGSVSPKPKVHKAACPCKNCHKKLRRLLF